MALAFQYKVEGINCMNCANGIKSHLKKKKIDIHPKHEVTAKQKIKTNLVFIFTVCIRS